jgi:hypothetical protein
MSIDSNRKRSRDILLQEYQKESNKNLESLNDIVRESIKSVAANRTLNDPTRNVTNFFFPPINTS